jgi:hypothetical protein
MENMHESKSDLLKGLGWSPELIEIIEKVSKEVDKAAVTGGAVIADIISPTSHDTNSTDFSQVEPSGTNVIFIR